MPFDGLVKPQIQSRPLAECPIDVILASLGIEPVPNSVLEAHKAKEISRHPTSFFYRHREWHHVMLTGSALVSMVAVQFVIVFADKLLLPHWIGVTIALFGMCSSIFMLYLMAFARTKGPASWLETHHRYDNHRALKSIPKPILNLVEQVHQVAPFAEFTIGTLYQEKEVLDPYITVSNWRHTSLAGVYTEMCLGIWDGKKIIQIAQTN